MKKIGLLCACILISTVLLSACQVKQKSSTINYKRRFEAYIPSNNVQNNNTSVHTIDLSEGPKLKYQADLGPRDLNFDIKLQTRY